MVEPTHRHDQHLAAEAIPWRFELPPPTILILPHLWLKWAKIAVRQERRSVDARTAGLGEHNYAPWLARETEESIQAVAAARHCLHNLYRVWRDSLGIENEGQVTPEAITTDMPPDPAEWTRRLKDLIGDRNDAVHYDEVDAPTRPHPGYPTNVSGIAATFTVERASEAVEIMIDVLGRVLLHPTESLQQFAADHGHILPLLERQRETGDDLW